MPLALAALFWRVTGTIVGTVLRRGAPVRAWGESDDERGDRHEGRPDEIRDGGGPLDSARTHPSDAAI